MSIEIQSSLVFRKFIDQKRNVPIIAFFTASWNKESNSIAQNVETIAKNYEDHIIVLKADIDLVPDLMEKYGAQATPHFCLFVDGNLEESVPKARLSDFEKLVTKALKSILLFDEDVTFDHCFTYS